MIDVKEVEMFVSGFKAKCKLEDDKLVCSVIGLETPAVPNHKKD